jgi:hypothetical protein
MISKMKNKFIFLFLLFSIIAQGQIAPSYPTIKLTKTVEGTKQDSLLVVGADKTVKHIPSSKLGTVKSVTGTDGITVANGTINPVIGIGSISQLKIAGLITDLGLKVDKVTGKSLLADAEISRLLGLSNYTHPTNHLPSIITQDASNRFVTDTEKATWNGKQTNLGYTPENIANKNIVNGYAGLGTDGKLISSQLPDITISDTFITASQAAMLALIAQTGDVSVRTDLNKTFILKGTNPTLLGDWQELLSPTSAVTTVFGRNGGITAQTGDYTADQITETATRVFQTPTQRTNNDATSPIQAQFNGKQATLASSTTNTLSGNTLQRAALIGDITSPLNSNTTTLATVNANVGTFGNASTSTTKTVNAKGLIIAISNAPIQIAESQVTSLVTDLASKETAFAKNTAFNKNFGTTIGTVAQGDDSRLSDSRTASDVYAWAKAVAKPSYTKSEVGLSVVDNTADANKSVNYANTSGSAPANGGTSAAVTINYSNDSNASYQMLWGSGTSVYGTGGVTCNPATDAITAAAFYQSSDRRLKNIYKRDGDVAYFKWKDGRDDKMHIGYIAQEVRKEFPDQVQKGDDKMFSVNYIEVLVAKIQDLEKRIQQLEKTK